MDLGALVDVCRAMDTDKMTERKRLVEKLRLLLLKPHIIKGLDRNTDRKANNNKQKLFAWDSLFKTAKTYIRWEIETLKKSKTATSALALSNRAKKKQEICALLKFIVRLTDKRGPRLRCADVASHVLSIMDDPLTCKDFGVNHTTILIKDILSVRSYWSQIPNKLWMELLGRYLAILQTPPQGMDRLLIAQTIYMLMLGGTSQTDLRGNIILPAIERFFSQNRNDYNIQVSEYIMKSCVIICEHISADGRVQVCKLGEGIWNTVLYLWKRNPVQSFKDDIVKFLYLQIQYHHPLGVQNENQGAYAVNWQIWMSNLRKLYEVLYNEVLDTANRSRFSSNRECVLILSENFEELAADVCHQLFDETTSVIEITQTARPAKKRRIDSGWDVILDAISEHTQKQFAIPWLQLLSRLITKYPTSVPDNEFTPIVSCLHQMLAVCKKADGIRWIMKCIDAIAISISKCDLPDNVVQEIQHLWLKITPHVVRSINLQHACAEAYIVMSTLLSTNQIDSKHADIWTIFQSAHIRCSENSLSYLDTCLTCSDVPEKMHLKYLTCVDDSEPYPLRIQLLHWILPDKEDFEENESEFNNMKLNSSLLARILICFILRDHKCDLVESAATSVLPLYSTPVLYLKTSFFISPFEESLDPDTTIKLTNQSDPLSGVQHTLFQLLERDCQYLLDTVNNEVASLLPVCHQCALMIQILHGLVNFTTLKLEELEKMKIWTQTQELSKRLFSCFANAYNESATDILLQSVEFLLPVVKSPNFHPELNVDASLINQKIICKKFMDLLMKILTEKINNNNSTMNGSMLDPIDSPVRPSSPVHMDLGFDDPISGGGCHIVNDFDDQLEANSQESEALSIKTTDSNVADFENLLSADHLTTLQTLQLSITDFVCSWCSGSRNQLNPDDSEFNPVILDIRQKITFMFNKKSSWNPSKPHDILLLRCVLHCFGSANNYFTENELEYLLEALTQVCEKNHMDQEVCSLILDSLCCTIPALADSRDVSDSIAESRECVMHIFKVFWNMTCKFLCSKTTRQAVSKCIHQLLKFDPDEQWTYLSSDDSKSSLSARCVEILQDRSLAVRTHSGDTLHRLFLKDTISTRKAQTISCQKNIFKRIYNVLVLLLEMEGRLSDDELKDEAVTRVSSLLRCLGIIAASSTVCEPLCMLAFCQIIPDRNINEVICAKILDQVSKHLRYPDMASMIREHLPFIIKRWFHMEYSIKEFPFKLLDYEDIKTFYTEHLDVILSFLVESNNMEAVQVLCSDLDQDYKDALLDHLPSILLHILPSFAINETQDVVEDRKLRKQIAQMTACFDTLVQHVPKKAIESCIMKNFDDIVVKLLMTLHEPSEAEQRQYSPDPNPPFYTRAIIKSTLDYLSKSHKSIVTFLSTKQDSIANILLSLRCHLNRTHTLHQRCRILSMYQLFASMLLTEFASQLGGSWAYILRDIAYTLLHIIHTMDAQKFKSWKLLEVDLVAMSFDLLYDLCDVAVNKCPSELSRFLSPIVGTLVTYSYCTGKIQNQCITLLRLLVGDGISGTSVTEAMHHAISLLPPFPKEDLYKEFDKVRAQRKYNGSVTTLHQEIAWFLEIFHQVCIIQDGTLSCLQCLAQQLTQKRTQLSQIITQDATDDNPVSILVQRLIQICSSPSSTSSVKREACTCLTLIGPIDLACAIVDIPTLHVHQQMKDALEVYEDEKNEMVKTCKIFYMLDSYLLDPNVDVVCAASRALKMGLATNEGIKFYNDFKTRMDDPLFKYLHPFKPTSKNKSLRRANLEDKFLSSVNQSDLWRPTDHDWSHDRWITNLVSTLINCGCVKDDILICTDAVCLVKVEFCETVFPYVMHDLLLHGDDLHRRVLSQHVNSFFNVHCQQYKSAVKQKDHISSQSVESMLNVVQYLRTQEKPSSGRTTSTSWDNNFWLEVDYLLVASAAYNCSAYFTTILYSEIWCSAKRELPEYLEHHSVSSSDSQQTQDSLLQLDSYANDINLSVHDVMLKAYHALQDPDGIYGCGAGKLADRKARIKTYEHEGAWEKALCCYDMELDKRKYPDLTLGMLKSLQQFGVQHLMNVYLKSCEGANGEQEEVNIREIQYEAAWRNGQWKMEHSTCLDNSNIQIHQALHTGMCALSEGDWRFSESAFKLAEDSVISDLTSHHIETTGAIYPILVKLSLIRQAKQIAPVISGETNIDTVLETWLSDDRLLHGDYSVVEPILVERCTLLRILQNIEQPAGVKRIVNDALVQHYQTLSKHARNAKQYQLSENTIQNLRSLSSDVTSNWVIGMEEANLYWDKGEINIAKQLMKTLIVNMKQAHSTDDSAALWYPRCLGIYGTWLAESKSENVDVILDKYLTKAVNGLEQNLADSHNSDDLALDAYLALARFTDNQYQGIVDYMKSSNYEAKQTLIMQARSDAQKLKQLGDSNSRYYRITDKQRLIDEQEVETLRSNKQRYLLQCMQNYMKCLQRGHRHNLRVFRIMALWFDNCTHTKLNDLIKENIASIQSYKFIPLMYQLAARMTTTPTRTEQSFQAILFQLIKRTVLEHPHHTLSIIMALAHANKDEEVGKSAKSRRSSKNKQDACEEGRMLAASQMIQQLKNNKSVMRIVNDTETLAIAYIQLANTNVDQYKKETKPIPLPRDVKLVNIKNLTSVAVPTCNIKVNPIGVYDSIISVQEFKRQFSLAGGINLPKIITCVGSDGVSRRQLVKGRDDLRQDAVMQQVFEMVNNLLTNNPETKRRKLQVRTYKVIPLSQRSGLLEWCEGTIPLGNYLINTNGAHGRYRPQDWSARQCREVLDGSKLGKNERMNKQSAYEKICEHFQPVFRHFFMENFPQPSDWYEKRLNYSKSVATNSIVGYVLGLGDRHVQNILIDQQTAELIHIDLGVAFEQGKILPTPETVPFRLTRDIIDGMGVAGVEGAFRRCCERTVDVMRSAHEALLTIVEVLLYDPLYAWTISPLRAYALQHRRGTMNTSAEDTTMQTDFLDMTAAGPSENLEGGENVNKVAERVLLRLQQKLQGVENGLQLSISGQVNLLIQEARDPRNLCRLFPGWQPYI